MMYMVFNQLYIKNGKYYYKKYGSYLPIESGTVYNLTDIRVNNYIRNGYKLWDEPLQMNNGRFVQVLTRISVISTAIT